MTKFYLLAVVVLLHLQSSATIRYVRPTSSGDGNGISWDHASGDLQQMINESSSTVVDTIFVSMGTYKPKRPANNLTIIDPTNRNNTFTFTKNVKVFGGFNDIGNPTWASRDRLFYPTALSGDIGVAGIYTDNCYRVILTVGNAIDENFVIDGFAVTKGYGSLTSPISVNGVTIDDRRGVGWYNMYGSPTLRDMTFYDNGFAAASGYGAGFHTFYGSPKLYNVIFSANYGLTSSGGGFHNINGNPILTNVLITGNKMNSAGGVYTQNGSLTLNNSTIAGNEGGGCYISSGTLNLNNSIIDGNASYGVQMDPLPFNNIVTNYNYSLVEGQPGGTNGNLDGTVLNAGFANPLPGSAAPTMAGNYRLLATSPCINTGSNSLIPAGLLVDLEGYNRIAGAAVDMGALESGSTPLPLMLTDFTATDKGCSVQVSWTIANHMDYLQYQIEASANASDFKALAVTDGAQGRDGRFNITVPQKEKLTFYRLKAIGIDGTIDYSRILSVSTSCVEGSGIQLYPNPANDQLTLIGLVSGQSVRLTDSYGKTLEQFTVRSTSVSLSLSSYAAGVYTATVVSPTGQIVKHLRFTVTK